MIFDLLSIILTRLCDIERNIPLFIFSLMSFYVFSASSPVLKDRSNPSALHNNMFNEIGDIKNRTGVMLKKLTYDIIKPPDHLEAVKMERDGHLNKNFRKEVFLGNEGQDEENEQLLSNIFHKADKNHNNFLNQLELEAWISEKVKEHFYKGVRENFLIFSSLDKDHNGRVTWKDYHTNFMMEQGFNESYANKHPEDHRRLERKIKEKILLDKAAWSEAANSDPEALNIDEFLTFRHPEHSHVSLLNMVDDIITSLDTNGDEVLTEEEFAEMPDTEETNRSLAEWKQERIKEFHETIDINHDGKVNRQELLMYNDPENPVHSKTEAKKLIILADVNKDGFLSLKEILAKKDVFLGSKMVDSARSFHDEF